MKTIGDILATHQPLAQFITKNNAIKIGDNLFKSIINNYDFSTHCRFFDYQNGELIIEVFGSAWATKVRYAIPEMIKALKLQPEFSDIKKIRYIISHN